MAAEQAEDDEREKEEGADAGDILRLTVCSHEFHAECLTGWFIFGKFSCPICRALFYGETKDEEKEESGGGEAQTEESQGGNSQSRLLPD